MIRIFTKSNYQSYCDDIASSDKQLKQIIQKFGYPPFWGRKPDFEGLVRIILEQQVSLASAFAVYKKVKSIIDPLTPERLIKLTDGELKSCGLSRQKTLYVKILAEEILDNRLDLDELLKVPNDVVRQKLIAIKGIGNWTCDIYLLMCLNRLDVFPVGDLALIKSMIDNKLIDSKSSKIDIKDKTEQYKPLRSILAMILWHAYIVERKIKMG